MEEVYALGVYCIENIQEWFSGSEWYFTLVNKLSNPNHITEIVFPMICVGDSVFGVQLLLSMAFGGWLNSILKWWWQEDRPYWWIRETTYYNDSDRPYLKQTPQTCETGPGSPSGHSAAAATTIMLSIMWFKHIMHDKKCDIWWWKFLMYPMTIFVITSVAISRMYIATHFPHQCLAGIVIGAFLAPALCIYVTDPFIWRYGPHSQLDPRKTVIRHVVAAVVTIIISVLAYYSLVITGRDPQWTVKLAFRWCESPDHIHVSSTPIFALVLSTGSMLGLALCVTPAVAEYRHYTKHRSLFLAATASSLVIYGSNYILANVCKSNTFGFYATHFAMAVLKPMLLLRVVPAIAMWPYEKPKQKVK